MPPKMEYDTLTLSPDATIPRVALAACCRDGDHAGCDFPGFCDYKIPLPHDADDETLRASLLHQQVLTGEASHRVKNSLQLVSSLLRMQSRATGNEELKRGLFDAQARIMAIAQVHDRLWQTDDIGNVDFSHLVKSLCRELQESSPRCQLVVDAGQIFGSADIGNSLALIICELVTNACKYAYPADSTGSVLVSLQSEGSTIVLAVRDHGCGLPQDFDPAQMKSLGMRLVYSLVQQLRGSISIENTGGAGFVIKLPNSPLA